MAGYHSLDRKAHLLGCYRSGDETSYRLVFIVFLSSSSYF